MMADIFISYRRDDAGGHAGRIYDRLYARFEDEYELFLDVDSVELGERFPARIKAAIDSCLVLIVVIGKNWLSAADKQGQLRLRDPDDWVRIEIRTALKRDVSIIPVLVGGAAMPGSRELPRVLARLADCTALKITDDNFEQGAKRLIDCLEKSLGQTRAKRVSGRYSSQSSRRESPSVPERTPKAERPDPAPGQLKSGKDGLVYQWIPPRFEYPLSSPVGNGFWIATFLVTGEDYQRVAGRQASHWPLTAAPALLSYSEAREYCQGIDGRLPTAAELQRAPAAPLPTAMVLSPPTLWTSDLHAQYAFLRPVLDK